MKGSFHRSCNCGQCRRGRNKVARNTNERKLRRISAKAILDFRLGGSDDVVVAPISSPYTD